MTTETFSFKAHTTHQLLDIIHSKDEYQTAAVEVAQTELLSRGYSAAELERFNKEWLAAQLLKLEKEGNAIDKRLKASAQDLVTKANPFNKTGVAREIELIILFSMALLGYQFYTNYNNLLLLVELFSFDGRTVLAFLPYLFVPVGCYYFYKRDPLGWVILNCWYTYLSVVTVYSILRWKSYAQIPLLNYPPLYVFVLALLVFVAYLYAANRASVREALRISRSLQWRTFAAALAVSILLALLV